jgi:hypothetical protein
MYLLELAAQAVRGFSPAVRITLKPGYLVLKPPGAEVPPLSALITALLYADGRGGDSSFIAPGQKTGKAGLTLLGNDQTTYRLVRELGGAGSLHKLDRASQKFAMVSEDAAETAQFLRGQVGVPDKSVFEQLFVLGAAQLPSRRPAKSKPLAAGISGPKKALASAAPAEASTNPSATQAKVRELERELMLSKELDQLQYRLDGVTAQLFELESTLKATDGLQVALNEAEAAFGAAPTPESLRLPKDILSVCERYPQLVQKRDEALAKLGLEGEEPLEEAAPAAVAPLTQDVRFLAGVGAGAAALGVGLMMQGTMRYLALLDIPAFGFAALVALKYIDDLQDTARVTRKGGFREAQRKKVVDSFEAEAQHVRNAMKSLGVETPTEVIEQLSRKPLLAEKVEDFRRQLETAQRDPAFAQASAKQTFLKKEQEDINQQLLEKGGGVRPTGDVERELNRAKESIALAKGGAPVSAAPGPSSATSLGRGLEDPVPALLKAAADFLVQDIPSIGAALKERSAQYIAALSDRRYQGVETDKDGRASVLSTGRKLPVGELPPKDVDLLYLALRLTLAEKVASHRKVPLLVEDAFGGLDEAKVPLLGRMLKHLGTLTQVAQVTQTPAFDTMADLVVKL